MEDAQTARGSFHCLQEISKWLLENRDPSPLAEEATKFLFQSSSAYLFWSLRLLGAPATPESPTGTPTWTRDGGIRLYGRVAAFIYSLTLTPTNIFLRLVLTGAVFDVLVALWVHLVDGEIPLYAIFERKADPAVDKEEWVIKLMHIASQSNGPGLVQAILSGRVCAPEIFVERTIQRMTALSKVYAVPHLRSVTSLTVENTNVGYIITLTEALTRSDDHLRNMFTAAKAPRAYIKVAYTSMDVFRKHLGRDIMQAADPMNDPKNSTGRLMRTSSQMAPHVGALLSWAASTPVSTIANVKDVLANGAVALLLDYSIIFSLPRMHRSAVDAVWDMMEMHALHLEIVPILCQHLRRSRFMLTGSDRDANLANDDREADLKAVGKRIGEFGMFAKFRTALCDNLNVS